MRTDWILDVVLGISAIFLFGLMLLGLPAILPGGFAYITAFLIFILFLSVMGVTVVLRSIGKNQGKKKAKKAAQ